MRPCRKVRYEVDANLHPEGTVAYHDEPKDEAFLFFFYSTTDVEHREEVPIYNLSALVSAVGGSLGLFLGVSFLDIMSLASCLTSKSCRHNSLISLNSQV